MSESMSVSFGWRLPDDSRLKVTFTAEVIEYQPARDRWLIRLQGPPPALDAALEARVPADLKQAIESLPGKWLFVPNEARNGLTLPLKLETLTGRIRYFYASDPRRLDVAPSPDHERTQP